MTETLGDRIKGQYEMRTRYYLPRRTYTIIRLDGKAFHTFTRKLNKPFDHDFMGFMNETAKTLCEEIQGVVFAYVQSDEISLLLTDFNKIGTNAFFDGNIQKIVSIAASMATAAFNAELTVHRLENFSDRHDKFTDSKPALFDARVFTIPDPIEVENYFIWRQQDATRNSIQMLARSLYSHKECNNKNQPQLHDMIHEKGLNWNNLTTDEKRGRIVIKEMYEITTPTGYKTDVIKTARTRWVVEGAPIFTSDAGRKFLKELIPTIGGNNE